MEYQYTKEWKADLHKNRVRTMRKREESMYLHANYYKPPPPPSCEDSAARIINLREDLSCREKICHWTYSVIDHFRLARQTVAISVDLFDRYMATLGNQCDADLALLTSLTTLYIAIKVNEKKKIRLSTLAELSREQFSARDIESMEAKILSALSWLVHPPTSMDFIYQLIQCMPTCNISSSLQRDIFELARYTAELAVCDPFFIEHHSSVVALASVLNVLEDEISLEKLPRKLRAQFPNEITSNFTWYVDCSRDVKHCRERLRDLVWEQQNGAEPGSPPRAKRSVSPTSITGDGFKC